MNLFKGLNINGAIDNDFLRNWVQISTWQTVMFLVLAIVMMTITWKVGKKTGSFTKMIMAGMAGAIIIGLIGGFMTDWNYSELYSSLTITETVNVLNADGTQAMEWVLDQDTGTLIQQAITKTVTSTDFGADHYWVKEVFGIWYGGAWWWIRALQMLITPTVFFAVIALLLKFGKDPKTKKIFLKGVGILLIGTAVAAVVGILVGFVFWKGLEGLPWTSGGSGTSTTSTLQGLIASFFPNNFANIFVNANSLIIPVIILAIAIGGFTLKMSAWGGEYEEAAKTVDSGVKALDKLFKTILDYLIGLLPLAIILLLSRAIVRNINADTLSSIGIYLAAVYVALIAMYFLQVMAASIFGKVSPIKYMKNTIVATFTGFTTQSSLGTLPVTIKTMKKAGVSEANAEVAPTLATTLGAHGCAGVFPALVVMALAAGGAFDLNITLIIQTVVIIVFASLGIAGVPGVAGVAVAIVLGGIGQSESYALYAALLLPLGSLIDMGRTGVNVNGGMMTAVIIDSQNGTLDSDVWSGKEKAPAHTADETKKEKAIKKEVAKAPVKKAPAKKAAAKKPAAKKTTAKKK